MLINEAMLKQKTTYDKLVDRIGTEKEYAFDVASYLIDDAIKNSQMLFIALKYMFQNRQIYTVIKLIYNVLKSTSIFKSCFQDDVLKSSILLLSNNYFGYQNDVLKSNIDLSEVDEYFFDVLKELKHILIQNDETDIVRSDIFLEKENSLIKFSVYKNGCIKCIFTFEPFNPLQSVFNVFELFFTTKTEGNNVFDYKIKSDGKEIVFVDDKNNTVCMVRDNIVELFYDLI